MDDKKLTEIYHRANNLDPKKHNPITTERIFAAMRLAMVVERNRMIHNVFDNIRRKRRPPDDRFFRRRILQARMHQRLQVP